MLATQQTRLPVALRRSAPIGHMSRDRGRIGRRSFGQVRQCAAARFDHL